MSYRSRSNVVLMVVMTLLGCSKRDDQVRFVRSKEYGSRSCWFDRSGTFSAFLVLAQDGRVVVPYPVSSRCMVDGDYTSNAEALLHHLNAVELLDSYGALKKILPSVIVSNSIKSDQPAPSPNSKVYYFNAQVTEIRYYYKGVYALKFVNSMVDTGISFDRLLEMSADEREKLRTAYEN